MKSRFDKYDAAVTKFPPILNLIHAVDPKEPVATRKYHEDAWIHGECLEFKKVVKHDPEEVSDTNPEGKIVHHILTLKLIEAAPRVKTDAGLDPEKGEEYTLFLKGGLLYQFGQALMLSGEGDEQTTVMRPEFAGRKFGVEYHGRTGTIKKGKYEGNACHQYTVSFEPKGKPKK